MFAMRSRFVATKNYEIYLHEAKTGGGKHAEICGNKGTLCGRAMQIFGNLNDWIVYLQRS